MISRSQRAFTLVEVVAATMLIAIAVATLADFAVSTLQSRVRAEAKRQGVLAAHARCEQFARGLIYTAELSALAPGESRTIAASSPADLPGGFPVNRLEETITAGPSGTRYATISVVYDIATTQSKSASVTEAGLKAW